MTLPDRCDACGALLMPWDETEDTRCFNCHSTVLTWEHLTPELRRVRTRLIAKREAIENAREVPVTGGVL